VSVRVLAPSQWKEDLKKEKIQDNEKHQPEEENNNKEFLLSHIRLQ
jgi:allantoicase